MKDINHKNNNTPDELTYSVADMSFYTNSFKNEIYIKCLEEISYQNFIRNENKYFKPK